MVKKPHGLPTPNISGMEFKSTYVRLTSFSSQRDSVKQELQELINALRHHQQPPSDLWMKRRSFRGGREVRDQADLMICI